MTRHMTALEEYDLRQAFEALDDAQSGRLSLRNVQTMALAYGYQYQKSPRLTLALLRSLVPGDENSNDWTIATVLGVFQKVRAGWKQRLAMYIAHSDLTRPI